MSLSEVPDLMSNLMALSEAERASYLMNYLMDPQKFRIVAPAFLLDDNLPPELARYRPQFMRFWERFKRQERRVWTAEKLVKLVLSTYSVLNSESYGKMYRRGF
jgi:hypothetical protein